MARPDCGEFGAFFKRKRLEAGFGLRTFCVEHGFDPGNISKIERGKLPPPQSRDKLEQYAKCLQIGKGSDDWYEFFDLAFAASGRIPEHIMSEEELVRELPVLFRAFRKDKPRTKEYFEDLMRRIRDE